jgi:hypothetical protein
MDIKINTKKAGNSENSIGNIIKTLVDIEPFFHFWTSSDKNDVKLNFCFLENQNID